MPIDANLPCSGWTRCQNPHRLVAARDRSILPSSGMVICSLQGFVLLQGWVVYAYFGFQTPHTTHPPATHLGSQSNITTHPPAVLG